MLNPRVPTGAHVGHAYHGPGPTGAHVTATVYLHPAHGAWMAELTAAGASHAWATSWGSLAASWIAPRLGHPPAATWPVIEVRGYGGVRFGHTLKFGPVATFLGADRPAFWIDDLFDGKDEIWADDRTERGVPTVVRRITSPAGLARTDIDAALTWLADVRAPRTQ